MMDNEIIIMKIEVKEEVLNKDFEASEKIGIDLITSKEFDQNHILNDSSLHNVSNHTEKHPSMTVNIDPFASISASTSEIPETKVPKRDRNGEKEYFDLPYGWTKQVVYLRNQPSMKGKVRTDIYLKCPGVKGKWIKSDIALLKYLKENPNIKCDQAVTSTSRKKHREFLEELKKKNQTKEISKSGEDLSLATIQIETMSKNPTELEILKPLKEQVKFHQKKPSFTRKRSNLIILDLREAPISKRIQTEDNPLVDKPVYASNYDKNQSLWKVLGEKQDIPEWSICLDCVPHKILKDSDESMDKHFAENPEHYQINPFHLCF
jgi:hypothetical protein